MLKKININDNEYDFVCEFRNTRNGFAHDCTLYVNGFEVQKCTASYINRTWERYEYQCVMQLTIHRLIYVLKNIMQDDFKNKNNYKNMTEKRRKEFNDSIRNNAKLVELESVYKALA